jgi:RNA polymerase sigma-70 factor (ECF subfamily)
MSESKETKEFMALYGRHQMDLYRYVRTLVVRAEEADDVMQETAMALWQRFDDYDESRPFLPWARRFAYFCAKQHRTRKARSKEVGLSPEVWDLLSQDYDTHEGRLAAQRRLLAGCMTGLGTESRDLLRQRYVERVSLKDLAVALGRSANALYLQLFRVRKQLLRCVEKGLAEEGWA